MWIILEKYSVDSRKSKKEDILVDGQAFDKAQYISNYNNIKYTLLTYIDNDNTVPGLKINSKI